MNTNARADVRSVEALDVLVVEDDGDSREILGIALEIHGARVRVSGSVQEALVQFGARAPDGSGADDTTRPHHTEPPDSRQH